MRLTWFFIRFIPQVLFKSAIYIVKVNEVYDVIIDVLRIKTMISNGIRESLYTTVLIIAIVISLNSSVVENVGSMVDWEQKKLDWWALVLPKNFQEPNFILIYNWVERKSMRTNELDYAIKFIIFLPWTNIMNP